MLRYVFAFMLLCTAGCQTTQIHGSDGEADGPVFSDRSERVLIRLDKYVGAYDVSVQRVVLTGTDPKAKDDWTVIGTARVSGYPNAWRSTKGFTDVGEGHASSTFLLDGEKVTTARVLGDQLVAKVIPDTINSARVSGVFTQELDGRRFVLPFDVDCNVGKVMVIYQHEAMQTPADLLR